MAILEPGCCDTDNALLRKILLALADVANSVPATSLITVADTVVATPGTAVQSASQVATKGVYVTAPVSNTGEVYVGSSNVDKGGPRGITLVPGGMAPGFIPVDNSDEIWVDADNANDRVGILVV